LSPGLGPGRDQYGCRAPAPVPADLSHTGLGDAVLAAIAASPHLARLIDPDGGGSKPKKSAKNKGAGATRRAKPGRQHLRGRGCVGLGGLAARRGFATPERVGQSALRSSPRPAPRAVPRSAIRPPAREVGPLGAQRGR
jgi:hypothetical protein